ncbi:MAG: hypothetical protein WCI47_02850 [bacterium]
MRITRETVIPEEEVEVFRKIYRDAFAALEELSPLRQSMTDEEFYVEMTNPSVVKIVGWDDHGNPAAILCSTNDIGCIPWLSPAYYARVYPEQFSARSLFWVGTILVHPDRRGEHFVGELIQENVRLVNEYDSNGVCLFDCCQYNADEMGLAEIVASFANKVFPVDCQQIDAQYFYAIRRVN